MVPSFSSFPLYIMAGTTEHAYFPQQNVVDLCNTQRCHQSLFGWDLKGKTDPPWEVKSYGRKGSAFEA